MTYEELNAVRNLRKKIAAGQAKIKALRDCATSTAALNFDKEKVSTKNTTSRVEVLTALIVDTESEVAVMQRRLIEAMPTLTAKLQAAISDNTEQTLMIYRYVACKYFRDIGFEMGYSENWVYWKHKQVLKKIVVD